MAIGGPPLWAWLDTKRLFVHDSVCLFFLVCCPLFPCITYFFVSLRLFISLSFCSLCCTFLYFHSIFAWSQPPGFFVSSAQPSRPQPCLSCSRFSFCWLVLIGLKWVTTSITESFKPSLNVSISWGSGALWFCLYPSGSPPDRRRNPWPDGGGKGLASGKIRRIMSALITMYTKTTGSVGAQTEQLSQIGWARGFSASTLTLISLCAPRLPTFRV